jgi:Domain of Unknown Function (DUF1080)
MRTLLPLLALGFGIATAAEPVAPAGAPQTVANVPGKLLIDDPLISALGKDWKVGKGKWYVADGAIRGAELKDDMHGAVARRDFAAKDAVVAVSFKLDGAKVISLSFNGAKGHISRVRVTPKGVSVQKDDQDGKNGPDTGAVLDTANVDIKAGEWHALVVELRGADILATLNGKHTAFGTNEAIAKDKTNIGLTVAGETASFKGLKVYEATEAAKDWSSAREKLLAERKKK